MNESIKLILNKYKEGSITEDEALMLIQDLNNNNTIKISPWIYPTDPWIYPTDPFRYPQVTYTDYVCY